MLLLKNSLFKGLPSYEDRLLLPESPELDPRDLIDQKTPAILRLFFTTLTGKSCKGENPKPKRVLADLARTLGFLVLGIVSGNLAFILSNYGLLLLPVSWSCILYSIRKLRLTEQHACSHNAIFDKNDWNSWLGEAISILTLTLNFKDYQRAHTQTHHSEKLLTPVDETYRFLINEAVFRFGMSREEAWVHFWLTLISPSFHLRQLRSRLSQTFFSNSSKHNLFAWFFWISILGIVAFTQSWLFFFWIWLPSITVLFQMSHLFRNCVEHRFALNKLEKTAAIFCAEKPPLFTASDSSVMQLLSWIRWWLRIFLYHVPSRIFVLTGDSPWHDVHHRYPGDKDWINGYIRRQIEVDKGIDYIESWGLCEAMDETFKSLKEEKS